MRKPYVPETVDEMRVLLGTDCLVGMRGVRQAQAQLAEWLVLAFEEDYPGAFPTHLTPERIHEMVMENARERWPDIDPLCAGLNEAERAMFHEMGPIA